MTHSKQARDEVINADVLVLGGGIAGCLAAIKARESGVDVLMIDKGNLGRSGLSHQMSGTLTCFDPKTDSYDNWYRECIDAGQWLNDQKRLKGMITETLDRIRDLQDWGVEFQKTNGQFIRTHGVGHYHAFNAFLTNGGFQLMSVVRGEVLRRGIRVIERVMTTDLLTSDGEAMTGGRITGAIGFNTRTGKFYVFKARATIIATGATCAIQPWFRIPSLSGDGKAMAFRAGCEMRNIDLSFYSYQPRDFKTAPGANVLIGEGAFLVNAEGKRFMQKWDPERLEGASRAVACRAMATEELEGRGPVYLDATHLDEAAHARIEQAIPTVIRSFSAGGLALRKDKIPYSIELVDHGPGGIKTGNAGETNIPALFAAGAASDHAEDGVSNIITHGMEAAIGGHRAGGAAARYAKQVDIPIVKEQQVQLFKDRMFAPMRRYSGLKHQEVREHCITIWHKGFLGPVRSERGLKKAISAAQEIRENEIPKLTAADYHDLTRCIGIENELLLLELLPRFALIRTESRGSHFREDYPERDDENWLKWVEGKKEDGGIKIWTTPIRFQNYPLKPEPMGRPKFEDPKYAE